MQQTFTSKSVNNDQVPPGGQYRKLKEFRVKRYIMSPLSRCTQKKLKTENCTLKKRKEENIIEKQTNLKRVIQFDHPFVIGFR